MIMMMMMVIMMMMMMIVDCDDNDDDDGDDDDDDDDGDNSTHSHPFQVSLPNPRTLYHKSSFIPRTCNLWNILPSGLTSPWWQKNTVLMVALSYLHVIITKFDIILRFL